MKILFYATISLEQKYKKYATSIQKSMLSLDFRCMADVMLLDFWISAIAVTTILINNLQANALQAWGTALAFRPVKTMKGAVKIQIH